MNGGAAERQILLARLEWLRLLGIDSIRCAPAGGVPAEDSVAEERQGRSPEESAPAPPAAAPRVVVQTGLFGVTEAAEETGPPARRARSEAGAHSPLAAARAPEAPAPAEALRLIREEIGDCRRCRLSEKRTHIVFGVGDPGARLTFVGEGPGVDEDRQGEPFVGRAGQLLTRIIESMGLRREEVYIANVVKCRPPENRTPLPDEIASCSPFLFQQMTAIGPRVIVCLGTPAAQTVLGTRETISRLRGVFREVRGIQVMPTFHPAYLLRNPAAKKDVWEDMKKVMAFLKTAG